MENKLLELYRTFELYQIPVYSYTADGYKATSIKMDKDYAVYINPDQIEDEAEEICILAHEYGHYVTGTTHQVCSPLDLVEKHEYKADKYAIHRLIPAETLQEALDRGYVEIWQLAECFSVTEEFVRRALDVYRNEGKLATTSAECED